MFGIQINDNRGGEILGMKDFTIRKIYEETIPAAQSTGTGSPLLITIPGYDADQCYVVISPISYYTSSQDGYGSSSAPGSLKVPVYVDRGGEVIEIIRYFNCRVYDPGNQRWLNVANLRSIACLVEVFKVFGNEQ